MSECKHKDVDYFSECEPCYQCLKCKVWLSSGEVIELHRDHIKEIEQKLAASEARMGTLETMAKRLYKDYQKSAKNYDEACGSYDERFSNYNLEYVEKALAQEGKENGNS